MRVLHVHAGNLYGGVETLLLTLVRHQATIAGLEHRFALCFEGRLAEELCAAGAPVTLVGGVRASLFWTVWRARRRVARLIAAERPDAVMFHSAWSLGLFGKAARDAGMKIALWLHGAVERVAWPERLARRIPPDLAVCNSRFTAGSLSRLFPGRSEE